MQVTQVGANHHHAEQWSSIPVPVQPDTLADIQPHPVMVRFQKFESGTSLKLTVILTLYARLIPASKF